MPDVEVGNQQQGSASNKVVVVTGASSGIGRGAARAFAARGDDVVLVARGEADLQAVADECAGLAGRTLVVPADVADEQAVAEVVRRTVEELGRIDAWVNDASVWSYGRFEDTPPEVFRAIVETTFFGAVHGARAVLPVFRSQGHGVLVNVASIYGHLTTPYVGPYVASKWALVGFSHVLRQELLGASDIHVCMVSPGAVDTPIYRHGANYIGRRMRPLPPAVPTRRVVAAIVRAVDRPRREIIVGRVHRTGVTVQRLAPAAYDRIAGPLVRRFALQDAAVEPDPGNVFRSNNLGSTGTDDGWRRHDLRTVAKAATVGGGLVGAVAAVAGRARRVST